MPDLNLQIQQQETALLIAHNKCDKLTEITAAQALVELYRQIGNKEMEAEYLTYVSAFYQTELGYQNFPKAIECTKQALLIYKEFSNWIKYFRKINALATIYEDTLNDTSEAVNICEDALTILDKNETMLEKYYGDDLKYVTHDIERLKRRVSNWKRKA